MCLLLGAKFHFLFFWFVSGDCWKWSRITSVDLNSGAVTGTLLAFLSTMFREIRLIGSANTCDPVSWDSAAAVACFVRDAANFESGRAGLGSATADGNTCSDPSFCRVTAAAGRFLLAKKRACSSKSSSMEVDLSQDEKTML